MTYLRSFQIAYFQVVSNSLMFIRLESLYGSVAIDSVVKQTTNKLTFWRRNYFFNFSTPCT